ncbi:alpha/beta fold hydrolase [Flavimaricola marinus]|uniref:Pimeloyl-[acyl-carrier protein] methyl ester esterase n=1 Tax=Flavimaricola marinus TaxID=1819565 RepID=A0A238L989_9RHOB|nr:alpha/beta hydrolase [Flavimaricola marinus]SMY06249.1 Pimeloyl-[acyl-carrier protein] methyl ester esterase [Flavimaricola marinus]
MDDTIWIHGAALNSGTWQPAPPGRCIDLPGHGAAARIADPTVGHFADAVAADLPERFALVGHSLGAMVCIELAARMPERCRALVLVDPPLRMPLGLLRRHGSTLARIVTRVPGPRGIAALMALRVERRSERPRVRQAIGAMSREGLCDAICAAAAFDGRAHLTGLTMPTLALLGKRSVLTGPRTAATLRRDLPQGTVETWDTGHMIPFDAPDAFFARVSGFLGEHS